MTRKSAGLGGGASGGGAGGGAGTPVPLSRNNSMQRSSIMKGLEGGKLTAAVQHAAATAESRHLCFDQASICNTRRIYLLKRRRCRQADGQVAGAWVGGVEAHCRCMP